MKWVKKGLIYVADGSLGWAKSHAMIPTPEMISEDVIRIYLTFCDEKGIGRIGYIDVSSDHPSEILDVSKSPIIDIGRPGTFDENGVLVCSVVRVPTGKKYLYYVGFEPGHRIRYRLLTGLAESVDNGKTFQRVQKTPILERSDKELFFRGGPYCVFESGVFKMWYVAGSSWTDIDGKQMPVYTINYLESKDGIRWPEEGKVCIDIMNDNEHGFGRPWVVRDKEGYQMYYSIRKKDNGYRLGYAESKDGLNWTRKDHDIGVDVSDAGWDSKTVCYSAVLKAGEKTYLFYNGNDFGRTGFGYAELYQ